MANYATNLFFASTENQNDLERIGQFLDENLRDSMFEMYDECIDGEFCSRWKCPEDKNWITRNVRESTYFRQGIALSGYHFDFSDKGTPTQ